jgi:Leucine Rich repeat
MHLKAIEGAIAQLNNFAALELDHYSPEVIESDFYQFMQTATELSAAAFLLLAKIAATSSTLHTLDLSFNYLGEHALAVAEAVAASPTLHTLDLSTNSLNERQAAGVAEALTESLTLHTLDLSLNLLDPDGRNENFSVAFGVACAAMPALHILNLSDNGLNGRQAAEIAEALTESLTLHTLDLSNNSLGAALKGFSAAFGAACAAMPALHILNLSNNDLAGEDKAAISAPIEAHNYEIAKWSLADEFFAGFTGTVELIYNIDLFMKFLKKKK